MEYLNTIRRWSCQKRFSNQKAELSSIECFVSYNKYSSFSSMDILRCHLFLENICGQKPFIAKDESGYVGSTKFYSVTSKVTLRKAKLFNFLKYLTLTAIPMNIRLNGVQEKINIKNNFYSCSFTNWNVFFGQNLDNLDLGVTVRLVFRGNQFFLHDVLRLYRVI